MSPPTEIRIGTRGSELALTQARWVARRLKDHARGEVSLEPIRTAGDVDRTSPIPPAGLTGFFTRELDEAVLAGRARLAVHSLKDLPTAIHPELAIVAVPEREDPSDVLVREESRGGGLDALRAGARVGTSSLRRQALCLAHRPDLEVTPIRGNLDTRIRKVDEGEYDAVVLAAAGLRRLGWQRRISQSLEPRAWPPAPGQGALAVVARKDDDGARRLARILEHPPSRAAVVGERKILEVLEAGCQLPVGALGLPYGRRLRLWAMVASPDGRRLVRADRTGDLDDPEGLGRAVAEVLLERGARDVLGEVPGRSPGPGSQFGPSRGSST